MNQLMSQSGIQSVNQSGGNPAPLRIAILGAESSGKSTLAEALAKYYQCVWVAEYLREFVQTTQRVPQEHEQILIAKMQIEREELALMQTQRFLFCDTTPVMTEIYSRYCFGRPDLAVRALAHSHTYDLTLVTAPDTPWVADGIQRVSDQVRQDIHLEVLRTLDAMGVRYSLITGSVAERLGQVIALLEASPHYECT